MVSLHVVRDATRGPACRQVEAMLTGHGIRWRSAQTRAGQLATRLAPNRQTNCHQNCHQNLSSTLEKDQTASNAEIDGFGAGSGTELAENRGHVEFDGVL